MQISSDVLYHCWRHEDPERAREILASILERGLLLTTNAGPRDAFEFDRGNGVTRLDTFQKARVCFTDIPFDLLSVHGTAYGRYGLGFARTTIVEWAGLPAWHIPNHWDNDTLKVAGPVLVNSLHAARQWTDHLRAVVHALTEKGIRVDTRFQQGDDLDAEKLIQELGGAHEALSHAISFIKEASPLGAEDFRYLHEREWRIVQGIRRLGWPEIFRELSNEEKRTLCAARPIWAEPWTSSDPNVVAHNPRTPIIDTFRVFDGTPTSGAVRQNIAVVLVPHDEEAVWVERALDDYFSQDEAKRPRVVVFPN